MVGALVILGFACFLPPAKAGPVSACDQIASDVKTAVAKDPSKVLMIVEDALVINEACACEIVKAAITASNAEATMSQQIVQTALAVAPKMAAIITECAESVAPGSAKNPVDVAKSEGTDFSDAWATNIRGIYLIQPAAAGVVTQYVESDDTEEADYTEEADDNDNRSSGRRPTRNADDTQETDDNENQSNSRRRTRNLVPLSPAWANQ